MLASIIVGIIFAGIIFFAGKKAFSDMRKGKCSGCSSCSSAKSCTIKDEITQIKL
ncbi:FeoB-associated Cys-rich membrane protein [Fusibacter bizertensis]|uniref:FeoB-associated Cys-rich membrane protein n=1 Tax=Fusibacter bizertensis TaxID=1488331 RepID=A0ABT6NA86_9FIRM|nr:FeoB-associated Cys-rich membrane protein [Fusibacter bizertensis]MDH8677325.1 FeoB-associated Cys-rich membrane protein [Fusibacter bizertensis]